MGQKSSHAKKYTSTFTLNDLPYDILTEIFEYAFTLKPKHAFNFSLVSKNFHNYFTTSRSNTIWRNISNCRWRLINTQMNISNWFDYFKKRYMAQSKNVALVDSCSAQSTCPLVFVRTTFVFIFPYL